MAFDIRTLAAVRSAAALPEPQRRLLFAMRAWVLTARAGHNPDLKHLFGDAAAARRFGLLMEQLVAAWTEPFIVGPPRCRCVRYDEMLLLDLIAAAGRGDAKTFSGLLADMLPLETRARLYDAATRFVDRVGVA